MLKNSKQKNKLNSLENKKVKNATKVEYDGISFKSRLELHCYKKLKESGIQFQYEPKSYVLHVGNKPNLVKFYDPDKSNSKCLKLNTTKLTNITYTPDFVGDNWIIETKGLKTTSYSIKMKILRSILEQSNQEWYIFEPHNNAQIDCAIKLISTL